MNLNEEPHVEVSGVPLPYRLVDGYQLHRAALSRGLEVLSLPRQVLLAGTSTTVPAELSFTHGVPEASDLSSVTFAQDHRLSRALLERAQVPKPAGASFSWRSISKAERWASNLGYPVVLREGVGENPVRAIRHIRSGEELRSAFHELRKRDKADRTPGSNPHIAGYATTRLTFTHDEDGNEVAPLRSRMLVEEDPRGRSIRAFVVGGRLVAAVELDDDQAAGVRDITGELPGDQHDVIVRAAQAIPGLACATIDAVSIPESQAESGRDFLVIGLAERPRIETYMTANKNLGERLGDALLEFQAEEAGVTLGLLIKEVTGTLEIEGLRHAENAADQLPKVSAAYGADIAIDHVDSVAGNIDAHVRATPEVLAALVELLMAGLLVDDRAAAVNYSKGSAN